MEDNRAKDSIDGKQFDAVVTGGGFKGMMAAYGLMKKGLSVCLVEKGKQLGGFMSPMVWQGVEVDKGPQYLDGVSESHKIILDEIMGKFDPLESLNYSYASYWNNTYTDGFAIPDYRSLPKAQKASVLFEALTNKINPKKIDSIADLYNRDNEISFSYIQQWCKKFLQCDAKEMSVLNQGFATFFGRRLLLDNELSLSLKKTPLFDGLLAAKKTGIDHRTHNLYPLNKNLGYFRRAFEAALLKAGVTVVTETEVLAVNKENALYEIGLSDGESIKTKSVYCAATIDSTEQMLLNNDTISEYIRPVAQVFYLIEVDLKKELPFYVMNYSEDSLSRVTNFTTYANKPTNGKSILCVEVPTTLGSELWEDPDKHYPILCAELDAMGIESKTITAHKAFKVPGTYRVVLCGYESQLQKISNEIEDKYGENVHILTPHLLTRASIMADLSNRGILDSDDK